MKQRYMTVTVLPALLAWSATFEAVQEKSDYALSLGQIKEAEILYGNFLKQAPEDEKGIAKARLAAVYYRDQEHEKAFKIFLEALDEAPLQQFYKSSNKEKKIANEALAIYLDHAGLTPGETAQKILSQYRTVFKNNPDFHELGYFIAVSFANLGQYDQFFEEFYNSYIKISEHFLAYKSKAALHVKLFERAKTEAEREEQREYILKLSEKAAALQPRDSSLYRMILGFTPDHKKSSALSDYLNKIINQNIVIARSDIPYYVEVAIAFEQYDLAQKFLDKAKEWYAYSRAIAAAQQHLDEKIRK